MLASVREGNRLLLQWVLAEGLSAEDLLSLGSAQIQHLRSPFHALPLLFLEKITLTKLQPAILELPMSLSSTCWFSVNVGQIRGLEIAQGVCFYEVLIVSLHCFCLLWAFLVSIKMNHLQLSCCSSKQLNIINCIWFINTLYFT